MEEHRRIYSINDEQLIIYSLCGHYNNKQQSRSQTVIGFVVCEEACYAYQTFKIRRTTRSSPC